MRCYEDTKLDNIVMEEIEGGSLPSNEVDDIAAFIAMANDVNRYIKISNVTITEKTDGQYTNQFAVDSDNNELWVYDKFQLGQTLTVGSTYDIEGIVTLYKSELELAITKITTDGNAVELVNADQLSFDGNSVINPNQVDIVVYSISGSIVKSGNTNLNLSDLHSGLYMVVSSNDILKVLK